MQRYFSQWHWFKNSSDTVVERYIVAEIAENCYHNIILCSDFPGLHILHTSWRNTFVSYWMVQAHLSGWKKPDE